MECYIEFKTKKDIFYEFYVKINGKAKIYVFFNKYNIKKEFENIIKPIKIEFYGCNENVKIGICFETDIIISEFVIYENKRIMENNINYINCKPESNNGMLINERFYTEIILKKINRENINIKDIGIEIENLEINNETKEYQNIKKQEKHEYWDKINEIGNFIKIPKYKKGVSMLNKYFDKILVINLETRYDRKRQIIQKFNDNNIIFDFIKAIDGNDDPYIMEFRRYYNKPITNESPILERMFKRKLIPNQGAWGYLRTWEKIIEDAIKHKWKRILIFDDDVIFSKNFDERLIIREEIIKKDWKLLYFGASQYNWKPISFNNKYYHPVNTDGSFAIGIDNSVYEELLIEIKKMEVTLDSGALRYIHTKYKSDCYVFYPNLCIADVTNSDISGPRSQETLGDKFKWDLKIYEFPFTLNLVSIIMPAYNAERTIEKSIFSILNQTYKNIELIIVDDYSTDNTANIIKNIMNKDNRIKYLKNDKNMGCYYSRNQGIKETKGKYITFQDADDISLTTRIEKQVLELQKHNVLMTGTKIIRTHIDNLDGNDNEIINLINKSRIHYKIENGKKIYVYCCQEIFGMVTTMFKRDVYDILGPYHNIKMGGDAEYCERLIYATMGKILNQKDSIHNIISNSNMKNIYYILDEVLYVCHKMTDKNITLQYKNKRDVFEDYINKTRENYRISQDLDL